MPKVETTPAKLKPYVFHLGSLEGEDHAIGDCPFCGREGKFSVDVDSGLWRCLVCNTGSETGKPIQGGNAFTFVRKFYETAAKIDADFTELALQRRLLESETLMMWGVAKSPTRSEEWLVPGYSIDGKLSQLYRYVKDFKTGKWKLLGTPGLSHCLFGVHLMKKRFKTVYICEGPWDAMALWEMLRSFKRGSDGKLVRTGSEDLSLLANAIVVAAPGCTTFREEWTGLFAGKGVVFLYDSDHPKVNPSNGEKQSPVGLEGERRASEILAGAMEPPAKIEYLCWGNDGYDPTKKSGYDVSDALSSVADNQRHQALDSLLKSVEPIPENWIAGRSKAAAKSGSVEIELVECESWKDLTNQWRKAMKFTEGLERGLSMMLACSVSTLMPGDQLWVQFISPPSTGKTSLCDAVGLNRKYTKTVGTFKGLHSGWQTDDKGEEDHSTIAQLKDKTLIIKDADPLLKATNRDAILADFRDAYDTNCSVQFKNRVKREYIGLRFTVIMCGTEALLELDSAEVGARFLVCKMMDGIDEEFESSINHRIFHRTIRNRGVLANGTQSMHDDAEMLLAKQMTGGYIDYLRRNSAELYASLDVDSNTDELIDEFNYLSQFVAFMRARPAVKQQEAETREMSARVNSQLLRCALSLAVVRQRTTIDDDVMRIIRRTATNTANGRTLDLAKYLYTVDDLGMTSDELAARTGHPVSKERDLLRFMKRIGAAESFHAKKRAGVRTSAVHWKLTPRMRKLYRRAVADNV